MKTRIVAFGVALVQIFWLSGCAPKAIPAPREQPHYEGEPPWAAQLRMATNEYSIAGLALDVAGYPLPQSDITVVRFDEKYEDLKTKCLADGYPRSIRSDVCGRFLVTELELGKYALVMRARGVSAYAWVELTRNEPATSCYLWLRQGTRLINTVEDETGTPIANALVEVCRTFSSSPEPGPVDAFAFCDGSGNFSVDNPSVPPPYGTILRFSAAGFAPLEMTLGEYKRGRRIVLDRGGSITGRITESNSGEPLQGVRVWLVGREKDKVAAAMTDKDGVYLAEHLPPGGYLLVPEHPLYVYQPREFPFVLLNEGKRVAEADIRMQRGVLATGRVVDPMTLKGVPDVRVHFGPRGVHRGHYWVYPEIDDPEGHTVRTDSEGRFSMDGLPSDTIEVDVWAKGWKTQDGRAVSFNLSEAMPGEPFALWDIAVVSCPVRDSRPPRYMRLRRPEVFLAGAFVPVQVMHSPERPYPEAIMEVIHEDFSFRPHRTEVFTGRTLGGPMEPGTYEFWADRQIRSVSDAGGNDETPHATITVNGGEVLSPLTLSFNPKYPCYMDWINCVLPKGPLRIRGVIKTSSGVPIPDVEAMIFGYDGPYGFYDKRVYTDMKGAFLFDSLPPGKYDLYLQPPFYVSRDRCDDSACFCGGAVGGGSELQLSSDRTFNAEGKLPEQLKIGVEVSLEGR